MKILSLFKRIVNRKYLSDALTINCDNFLPNSLIDVLYANKTKYE